MIHSERYSKALVGITLASVVMLFLVISLVIGDLYFDNKWVNIAISILTTSILWGTIGFYTNKMKEAAIVGGVAVVLAVLFAAIFFKSGNSLYPRLIRLILDVLLMVSFGLLLFKSSKAWWFILIPLIMVGNAVIWGNQMYFELWENLADAFGFGRNLFSYYYAETAEGGLRSVHVGYVVLGNFINVLEFIIFAFIYEQLKKGETIDKSALTIPLSSRGENISYAITHWVTRTYLIMGMFGIYGAIQLKSYYSPYTQLMQLAFFGLSVYIIGSIYRNFLLSYYQNKWRDSYPSWFYLFLQTPFFHIFFWAYMMLSPQKNTNSQWMEEENILDVVEQKKMSISKTQDRFLKHGRNPGIQALTIISMSLALLATLASGGRSGYFEMYRETGPLALLSLITIGLYIWYMNHHKALYIIIIMLSICLAIGFGTSTKILIAIGLCVSFFYLVINYPIFHFDRFKFVEEKVIIEDDLENEILMNI